MQDKFYFWISCLKKALSIDQPEHQYAKDEFHVLCAGGSLIFV